MTPLCRPANILGTMFGVAGQVSWIAPREPEGDSPIHAWRTRDITPTFGSQIEGFEPGLLTDPEVRRTLQELFDRRGVLVFREVDISYEQQVDLTLLLSGIESTDAKAEADSRGDRWYVSNDRPNSAAPFGRLQFHSDMMWSDRVK